MWTRKDIKKQARQTIRRSYWRIIAVILIVACVNGDIRLNVMDSLARADLPDRGVLAGIVRHVVRSQSFVYGFLNAMNQMIFKNRIGAGAVILAGAFLMFLFWFFARNVLSVGRCRFFLETRGYMDTPARRLGFIWRLRRTSKTAGTMFFKALYTALWSLTIAGGIIKTYSYVMIPYILAEDPDISRREAFYLSRRMMDGEKWAAFKLDLSFLGWQLLGWATLGLCDWLIALPYRETAYAELYIRLRGKVRKQRVPYADRLKDKALDVSPKTGCYPAETYFIKSSRPEWRFQTDPKRHYRLLSLILIFFAFSVVGWLWEEGVHLFMTGEFVKRGTMAGPWLPIYGAGGVLSILLLKRLSDRPAWTYVLTVLLCGTIEYASAWFLWKTVHMKWWDYTGYFANIHGRVCLEGLIVFGLGGCAAIYLFGPLLDELFSRVSRRLLIVLCAVLLLLFAADGVYSIGHPNTGKGITKSAWESPVK